MFWIVLIISVVLSLILLMLYTESYSQSSKKTISNIAFVCFAAFIILLTGAVIIALPTAHTKDRIDKLREDVEITKLAKGKISEKRYYLRLIEKENKLNRAIRKRRGYHNIYNFLFMAPWDL